MYYAIWNNISFTAVWIVSIPSSVENTTKNARYASAA